MESLLERMGVTYHWEGDFLIPDLVPSDTTDYHVGNAVMESFFGIFKTEALRLYPPQTLAQARTLVHDYILYYNTERMLLK